MPITDVMAVVTVADFEKARGWYEQLFGRPADEQPMDGLAQWQVAANAVVQVVQDAERGGSALLTLGVDDLDALTGHLSERGLPVGDAIDGVISRIASITDPAGNTVTFAQLHGAAG